MGYKQTTKIFNILMSFSFKLLRKLTFFSFHNPFCKKKIHIKSEKNVFSIESQNGSLLTPNCYLLSQSEQVHKLPLTSAKDYGVVWLLLLFGAIGLLIASQQIEKNENLFPAIAKTNKLKRAYMDKNTSPETLLQPEFTVNKTYSKKGTSHPSNNLAIDIERPLDKNDK